MNELVGLKGLGGSFDNVLHIYDRKSTVCVVTMTSNKIECTDYSYQYYLVKIPVVDFLHVFGPLSSIVHVDHVVIGVFLICVSHILTIVKFLTSIIASRKY